MTKREARNSATSEPTLHVWGSTKIFKVQGRPPTAHLIGQSQHRLRACPDWACGSATCATTTWACWKNKHNALPKAGERRIRWGLLELESAKRTTMVLLFRSWRGEVQWRIWQHPCLFKLLSWGASLPTDPLWTWPPNLHVIASKPKLSFCHFHDVLTWSYDLTSIPSLLLPLLACLESTPRNPTCCSTCW